MKNVYQVLNKEEKRKVKEEFKKNNQAQYSRLIRIILIGLGLIIFSLVNIIIMIVKHDNNIYLYGSYILFAAMGIFFIFEYFVIRKKELLKIAKKRKK